jgi:hypothetical protein
MAKWGMAISITVEAENEEAAIEQVKTALASAEDFDIEDGPELVEEEVLEDEDE